MLEEMLVEGEIRKAKKKSVFSISNRGRIEWPEAKLKAPGGRGGEWGRGLLFGQGLALILCPQLTLETSSVKIFL